MTTINAILNKSMEEIFKLIATKFSGEDFTADDIMEFMKETKKGGANIKDPNKPKRAKSAYLFYCDDHRPKILDSLRKKKKKVNIAEVSKQLGAKWKGLSDTTKAPYEAKAQADRERYQEEMEEYNA